MKKFFLLFAALIVVHSLEARRNGAWAVPVPAVNVSNFFKVDEGLYRSSQPDAKGFAELEAMGITEVLNLRDYHSDVQTARNTKLVLHRVKMNAAEPDRKKLVEALRIIKNRNGPMLVHCWHGSDRTGIVCALYRLVFQNWTKEDAVDELKNGGYGYHAVYDKIITFLNEVDVEKLKEDVYLSDTSVLPNPPSSGREKE